MLKTRKGLKPVVPRESRWLDYFLVLMMCDLALFCAGQGVNQPLAANLLIGISALGTVVSYTLGKMFRGSSIVLADGWIYTIAALIAFFFQPVLNTVLPEDAFKDLATPGLLCWMIALGSFGVWRDGTLLFQAVPSLALFGLVGVYDTFPQAHYLFFGFLLLLSFPFWPSSRAPRPCWSKPIEVALPESKKGFRYQKQRRNRIRC